MRLGISSLIDIPNLDADFINVCTVKRLYDKERVAIIQHNWSGRFVLLHLNDESFDFVKD